MVIAEYLRKTMITRTWNIAIISGTFLALNSQGTRKALRINNKGKLVNKQRKCQSFILIFMFMSTISCVKTHQTWIQYDYLSQEIIMIIKNNLIYWSPFFKSPCMRSFVSYEDATDACSNEILVDKLTCVGLQCTRWLVT